MGDEESTPGDGFDAWYERLAGKGATHLRSEYEFVWRSAQADMKSELLEAAANFLKAVARYGLQIDELFGHDERFSSAHDALVEIVNRSTQKGT